MTTIDIPVVPRWSLCSTLYQDVADLEVMLTAEGFRFLSGPFCAGHHCSGQLKPADDRTACPYIYRTVMLPPGWTASKTRGLTSIQDETGKARWLYGQFEFFWPHSMTKQ